MANIITVIRIIVIAVIRVINRILGYVMRKEVVALHTLMNKATGMEKKHDKKCNRK